MLLNNYRKNSPLHGKNSAYAFIRKDDGDGKPRRCHRGSLPHKLISPVQPRYDYRLYRYTSPPQFSA